MLCSRQNFLQPFLLTCLLLGCVAAMNCPKHIGKVITEMAMVTKVGYSRRLAGEQSGAHVRDIHHSVLVQVS